MCNINCDLNLLRSALISGMMIIKVLRVRFELAADDILVPSGLGDV